jgi:acyl-CoA synthetase (AMP-forming)/AMP-acid ligase II
VYVEANSAAAAAARQSATGSRDLADTGSWKQRTAAKLLAHCRALLQPAAVPAVVVVSGRRLPRSPAGKLDRGALTEPEWTSTHSNPGKRVTAVDAERC